MAIKTQNMIILKLIVVIALTYLILQNLIILQKVSTMKIIILKLIVVIALTYLILQNLIILNELLIKYKKVL